MSKSEDTDKNSKQQKNQKNSTITKEKKHLISTTQSAKLTNARVIQKQLVYVIGLSFNLSSEKV